MQVCRKALINAYELPFFFYQYALLSSRSVDDHQMYSGGSIAAKGFN